ncbi:MAG TPA: thioredoxin family protein [Anaerolineae bacterium]
MRPIVNGLEQEYGDQIDFRRHNIVTEEGQAWARQYQLRGHPAYVLVDRKGQERWRYVGVVAEETMAAALAAVLAEEQAE